MTIQKSQVKNFRQRLYFRDKCPWIDERIFYQKPHISELFVLVVVERNFSNLKKTL